MKTFIESGAFKIITIIIMLVGNIAFYTVGEQTGAQAAVEVSPLFLFMIQGLFTTAILSYIYFFITKK